MIVVVSLRDAGNRCSIIIIIIVFNHKLEMRRVNANYNVNELLNNKELNKN